MGGRGNGDKAPGRLRDVGRAKVKAKARAAKCRAKELSMKGAVLAEETQDLVPPHVQADAGAGVAADDGDVVRVIPETQELRDEDSQVMDYDCEDTAEAEDDGGTEYAVYAQETEDFPARLVEGEGAAVIPETQDVEGAEEAEQGEEEEDDEDEEDYQENTIWHGIRRTQIQERKAAKAAEKCGGNEGEPVAGPSRLAAHDSFWHTPPRQQGSDDHDDDEQEEASEGAVHAGLQSLMRTTDADGQSDEESVHKGDSGDDDDSLDTDDSVFSVPGVGHQDYPFPDRDEEDEDDDGEEPPVDATQPQGLTMDLTNVLNAYATKSKDPRVTQVAEFLAGLKVTYSGAPNTLMEGVYKFFCLDNPSLVAQLHQERLFPSFKTMRKIAKHGIPTIRLYIECQNKETGLKEILPCMESVPEELCYVSDR